MATSTKTKPSAKSFRVDHPNDWCPGCGDFGILGGLQQALTALELAPHEVCLVGGIGCSGKTPYYVNAYGVHTLHGRPLPFATGIKLANPQMTVVIVGGDGDGLGIGAGHFVHAGRRNVDMTYILFHNEVYGLTKGQAAPTLGIGMQPKSLPEPNIQDSINGPALAHTSGFTWIGRSYSYNVKHMVSLIVAAIRHNGLSYLEVMQPCPTYNNLHDKEYYGGDAGDDPRLKDLQKEQYEALIPAGADEATYRARTSAFMAEVSQWGGRIPVGIMLENQAVSSYEQRVTQRIAAYASDPPARRVIADDAGRPSTDISALLANESA